MKRQRGKSLITVALLAAMAAPVSAEPLQRHDRDLTGLDIETLMGIEAQKVYGASKYQQNISEAPSAVTIVTSEDIRHYGYRTIADVLRSVRGFHIINDRNYRYAGIRSFSRLGDFNSKFLLLVDGHRLNNAIDDTAAIGNDFPVDIDLVDRIEVIPGPGSSLYGSNAFFAVVNIITKFDFDLRGGEVSGEGASYRTYKGRVSAGLTDDHGFGALLSASALDSKGQSLYFREFDTPATNNGIAGNADREQGKSLFAKFRYNDFTLLTAGSRRAKNIPTAPYSSVFNDPRTRTTDTQALLDLRFERDIAEETSLLARVYYDYWGSTGDYAMDYPPLTVNRDSLSAASYGGELKATRQVFSDHRVTLGLEYRNDFRRRMRNADLDPAVLYLDRTGGAATGALYLQDEIKVAPSFIVNAGLRYDKAEAGRDMISPRLAAIWSVTPRTVVKALYGQAFRNPDYYARFYTDGEATTKANPGLEPERISTYEIALEQAFPHQVQLVLSSFYYRIRNLIVLQTDPADDLLHYVNGGRVAAYGIETEVRKVWASGAQSSLSYSYLRAEVRETGALLSNSPQHMAKLHLLYPLARKELFGGVEMLYFGKRSTVSGGSIRDYVLTNVTLFAPKLWKRLDVSASVYNILDTRYSDPASGEHRQAAITQDGRNFRVKLTYSF